jgi:hypothetical protein
MTPTQDDLRNAMNNLTRTTEPLEPASVLREGKRRRTRRRLAGVAGAAAAVLAVTGGIAALRPSNDGNTIVGGSGTAIQDLDNSLDGLKAGNYAFTRTGAYLLTDIVRAQIDVADGYAVEYRYGMTIMRAGDTTYLKTAGAGTYSQPGIMDQLKNAGLPQDEVDRYAASIAQMDGKHWLRADQRRLVAAAAVDEQSSLDYIAAEPTTAKPDITGADELISAVTTAERTGDTITGTLDATMVDDELRLIIGEPASYYGPAAKSMRYQATLDGQGRLTSFTLDFPGTLASQPPDFQPEAPLIITVTQYDGVEAPQAPAGAENITELTYDLLARDND